MTNSLPLCYLVKGMSQPAGGRLIHIPRWQACGGKAALREGVGISYACSALSVPWGVSDLMLWNVRR